MSSRRRSAAEQLAATEQASRLVASGTFIHANPSDPVHYGKGRVRVYENTVFLESDFEVGPGPAFHVYLVPKSTIRSSSDLIRGVLDGLAALDVVQRRDRRVDRGVPEARQNRVVGLRLQRRVTHDPAEAAGCTPVPTTSTSRSPEIRRLSMSSALTLSWTS